MKNEIKEEVKKAFIELHKELGIKCEIIGDIEVSKIGDNDLVYTFTCRQKIKKTFSSVIRSFVCWCIHLWCKKTRSKDIDKKGRELFAEMFSPAKEEAKDKNEK